MDLVHSESSNPMKELWAFPWSGDFFENSYTAISSALSITLFSITSKISGAQIWKISQSPQFPELLAELEIMWRVI